MTDHDIPSENKPSDNSPTSVDAEVDRRLNETFHAAATGAPKADRHAFVAAAQVRRDRLRRRRRALSVIVPIAAAALVLIAVGIIATPRDDASTEIATVTDAESSSAADDQVAIACPPTPGDPNTEAGKAMFDFTPNRLVLCTYGVDGALVATNTVPGPDEATVVETLDYIQRAYVDRPTGTDEPQCANDEVAVDRIGVLATGDDDATAWIATVGCSTSAAASGSTEPHDDNQAPATSEAP